METLLQLASLLGPTIAAYIAVKVGISEAMFTARQAKETADKAHSRIDSIMDKARA